MTIIWKSRTRKDTRISMVWFNHRNTGTTTVFYYEDAKGPRTADITEVSGIYSDKEYAALRRLTPTLLRKEEQEK